MVNIKKDHYWYDQDTKKMWHGRGGELKFRYDADLKKSVPYMSDVEAPVRGNNFDDIQKWIQKKKLEFGVSVVNSAVNHFVLIEIDDDALSDVEEDLYRHGIAYD